MYNNREYLLYNLNTASVSANQIFTGKGTLHSIVINRGVEGGTIRIIDGTSGNTATVGTITMTGTPLVTLEYDAVIANGLRIVASTSPDVTILYTK